MHRDKEEEKYGDLRYHYSINLNEIPTYELKKA